MSFFSRLKDKKDTLQDQIQEMATKDDIKQMKKDIANNQKRLSGGNGNREMGQKVISGISKGFGDIVKSMSKTSAPGHRPKIAQMPALNKFADGMYREPDYDILKSKELRGRDIRGKREKRIDLGGKL